MKKVRFGLLAKIMLFTGILTVLTVSTSLTVNLLISRRNSRETYKNLCQEVTDNIESVFFSNQDSNTALDISNKLVEGYLEARDKIDNFSEEEAKTYNEDMRVRLFEPSPGSMGLDYDKALRRNHYVNSVYRIQSLCATSNIPFASIDIYDVEYNRLIRVAESGLSVDENFQNIAFIDTDVEGWETDYYKDATKNSSYKTVLEKDLIKSCNLIEKDLSNSNFKCFVRCSYSLSEANNTFSRQLAAELIISLVSAAFLVVVYAVFTKLFLLRNVDRLKHATDEFVGNMKENNSLKIVDAKVTSHDEMRDLSDSFNVMQNQMLEYVGSIKKAKAIEQAFNMEVEIASKIQLESLPAQVHFNKNIELRAFIKPAKGVGGDFYDYFYVDEDHLAVVIADVSGKGIPASLFMMRSKESIRSACMNEKDLSAVLYKVNNSLCLNNKEGFFVTVFLGIVNIKTNEFDYISAGHERPFIKRDNECKQLEAESNFVLGLEEDFVYKNQSIKLEEGDSIVLYTDGLNESINSEKEEFGYENIRKSLEKDGEIKQNVARLIEDLGEFVGLQEQFDDITLLSFNIKKNVETFSYLNPTYEDIDDLTNKVNTYLNKLDEDLLSKIDIVIDEAMNNIISYGKTKTNKILELSIEKTDGGANLIFVDNSHPFNPLLKERRTVQENLEEGIIGGLGISIIKSISKDAEYSYSNNKNILVIKF